MRITRRKQEKIRVVNTTTLILVVEAGHRRNRYLGSLHNNRKNIIWGDRRLKKHARGSTVLSLRFMHSKAAAFIASFMLQKCVLVASQHIRTATTTIEAIWPGTGNDTPAGYIGDVYLHGILRQIWSAGCSSVLRL